MRLNKYDVEILDEDFIKNIHRLTNQIWKIIPMKENKENWEKQLDTVLIELVGLNELLDGSLFLQLISKLEGLKKYKDLSFEIFRKTIFESITLLQEGSKNI